MTIHDCDLRAMPSSVRDLLPWLDDYWSELVELRGTGALDMADFPRGLPLRCRPEWRGGALDGGDPTGVGAEVLAPLGTDLGVVSVFTGAVHVMNPWYAQALTGATNDWLAAGLLSADARLRGSISVSETNIPAAVDEIARRAEDPRFVQVALFSGTEIPLGRMHWWPVYEAAQAADLTISILPGSARRHATTPSGWPSHLAEDHAAQAQAFEMQLLSLLSEGVFSRFPRLRVILVGSGATWLPAFIWRITKLWRGTRLETPWVDRPPADIIRDHVFATLTPFDGVGGGDLDRLCEEAGSDSMWLAGSAAPMWHFDGDDPFAGVSTEMRRRISDINPRLAHPRMKEPVNA